MRLAALSRNLADYLPPRQGRLSPMTRGALIVGVVLTVAISWAAAEKSAKVAVAAPVGLILMYLLFTRTRQALIVALCMLTLVPFGGTFLGVTVPFWMQIFAPALLLGAFLQAACRRGDRPFAVRFSDIIVVGFIIWGVLGIAARPELREWKWFMNQSLFPTLFYFIARWLPIERKEFLQQKRWQLLAAFVWGLTMMSTSMIGFDPLYAGFGLTGPGTPATGGMGIIAEAVPYASFWTPWFMWADAIQLPAPRSSQRYLWHIAGLVSAVATLATTERSGILALGAGMLICATNRRMWRPLTVFTLTVLFIVPIWLFTGAGQSTLARFSSLSEEGAGFERVMYRRKALDYMRSPLWNPILGCGYARLDPLSVETMPEAEWFYDYYAGDFRPMMDYADRHTHCAPITVLGEFGYGGSILVLGVGLAIVLSFSRGRRLAQARGRPFDSALVTAAVASFGTIMANGLLHNVEKVERILFMMWTLTGIFIGHPDTFVRGETEASGDGAGSGPTSLQETRGG